MFRRWRCASSESNFASGKPVIVVVVQKMKLYTIVESFSPSDGEKWHNYCEWRGMTFERFDSIDGMLRPNQLGQPEGDDWKHIVNKSFMLHLIKDLPYAQQKKEKTLNGVLIEIRLDDHSPENERFLGFDIIDGYFDISLLTNFGNDIKFVNQSLSNNGLILDIHVAEDVFQQLKNEFASDPHVEGCRIVSLYSTKGEQADEGNAKYSAPNNV